MTRNDLMNEYSSGNFEDVVGKDGKYRLAFTEHLICRVIDLSTQVEKLESQLKKQAYLASKGF